MDRLNDAGPVGERKAKLVCRPMGSAIAPSIPVMGRREDFEDPAYDPARTFLPRTLLAARRTESVFAFPA